MYTVRSVAPGCRHALEISKLDAAAARRHIEIAEREGHKVWFYETAFPPKKFIG